MPVVLSALLVLTATCLLADPAMANEPGRALKSAPPTLLTPWEGLGQTQATARLVRRTPAALGIACPSIRPQACATPTACCEDPCCRSYADWWNTCRWGAEIALGSWVPGVDGDVGLGPFDTDIDISVGDYFSNLGTILADLEFMLQGSAAVQYGRWRLGLEVSSMQLGQSFKLRQAGRPVEGDFTLTNWQVNLYYRAGMSRLGCGACPQLIVYEPYVGIRGMNVDVSASVDPVIGLDAGDDWIDPVVGCKFTWDFRNRWAIELDGDIGGFGVASDLTWKLRLGVGWRFSDHWRLRAGWMVIDTDYESGTGLQRFKWDVMESGPFLGIGFSF